MCWTTFELHRIPSKVQLDESDWASSSCVRDRATYSLQLLICKVPKSPRHMVKALRRVSSSRPRSRAEARLHQAAWSAGSALQVGPVTLQPDAIWTWLIARAT